MDFIQQLVMTNSVTGLRRSSKALPKAKLAPKKGDAHCLVNCCLSDHYSFLNPGKPLHLRSMLSESMRCTKNCNSWHWSTGQSQFFCTTMSEWTLHSQCFKSWMNWALKLCLMHCSPDLSPTNYHFFKHLNNVLQRKCFHNQQEAENAFQEFDESQSTDFTLQE